MPGVPSWGEYMTLDTVQEITASLLLSAGVWGGFWLAHQYAAQREPKSGYYLLTAPGWLSFFCGRPLPDHKLDLSSLIGQLGALLAYVLRLLALWIGLDFSHRARIQVGAVAATLVVAIAVQGVVALVARLK